MDKATLDTFARGILADAILMLEEHHRTVRHVQDAAHEAGFREAVELLRAYREGIER